ncbi:MAG: FmdB family zinc ribbon protein [Christensenellales bacterium]
MPLLKFICEDCGHIFEELTSADKKPPCPECASPRVARCYQGKCYFGASGSSKGTGGGCSGGSCSGCSGCS